MSDLVLHGELTETAYILPDDLTFDEWAEEIPVLVRMAVSSLWWLGDALSWGEVRFGEQYAQVVEATGLAEQTLRNAVWVCSRIPADERLPGVPWSHHRAAASLPPRERRRLLRRVEKEHLPEHEVRAEVRRLKDASAEPIEEPEPVEDLSFDAAVERAVAMIVQAEAKFDWRMVAAARRVLDRALAVLHAESAR